MSTYSVKQYNRNGVLVWRYPMTYQPGLPKIEEAIRYGNVRGLAFKVVDENDNVVYDSDKGLVESRQFLQE